MNPRVHDAAMKMRVDRPKGRVGKFLRPFRAPPDADFTQGSACGSTLGYIPAAASRLKGFAISFSSPGCLPFDDHS